MTMITQATFQEIDNSNSSTIPPKIKTFYYNGDPILDLNRLGKDFDFAIVLGGKKIRWLNGGHKLPIFKGFTRRQVKQMSMRVIALDFPFEITCRESFEKSLIDRFFSKP